MSLSIHVDAYSGYKANERPIRFWLDAQLNDTGLTGVYEIEAIEDRWYDPNAFADDCRPLLRFSTRLRTRTFERK